jgi:hypothetical protein
LKLKPNLDDENWDLVVYSDSDLARDVENRISRIGFIIYLLELPIYWRSKRQKGLTLSSGEAKYVAMSESKKEIRFIFYLLRYMGISVKLPIMVRTGNIGAMFMAENACYGVRYRNIDTRYNFIRENVEDGFIKNIFVKTARNDSDLSTRNVNKDSYKIYAVKLEGRMMVE